MPYQKISKLTILIEVLKDNYGDYYNQYITYDFLGSIDEDNISDSIAYLMEHVRKLKKKDKEYPNYLKHCYTIFLELQYLVRCKIEETDKQYIQLIQQHLITKSTDRLLLLELAINNEDQMKKFCKEVKKDKKEIFSEVIINVIKKYDDFKDEKIATINKLNHHIDYFHKKF